MSRSFKWLMGWCVIYLIVGLANIWFKFIEPVLLSMAYCVIISLPLYVPRLARFCNMKLLWEK
jgi:hypothetical protein